MLTGPSLYHANDPASFWRIVTTPAPTPAQWAAAVAAAAGELPIAARVAGDDIDELLYRTLGEGQLGPNPFRLSPLRRLYYEVKPMMPRPLSRWLRWLSSGRSTAAFPLGWPIEGRFAHFQWQVARHLLRLTRQHDLPFIHFWPDALPYAFVLTHDVETADGQAHVRAVADLDASYGFRSSFNFVPERYPLDYRLMDELRERGFEIGVHGLKHDGKDFRTHREFMRRAQRINRHLHDFGAVGFRAPLTHRHPGWMQALDIDYDLSFFDSDPYEPMPGGTMSLWPFMIGKFLELPYTLVQDYTLTAVLKETTPRVWLDKVDFIRAYSGLALVNTHPDYLRNPVTWGVYEDFLRTMRERDDYWHALPRAVSAWWRARAAASTADNLPGAVIRSFRDAEVPTPVSS